MINAQDGLEFTSESDPCLIVVLGSQIAYRLLANCPADCFAFEKTGFVDQGLGSLIGFYDWLRTTDQQVIGVRLFLPEELEFLETALRSLPYVSIELQPHRIEIYFTSARDVVQSISDDQDFGNNRLYRSTDGTFAISFNADTILNSLTDVFSSQSLQIDKK